MNNKEFESLRLPFVYASFILCLPWIIFAIEEGLGFSLHFLGVLPRTSKGLIGIFTHWLPHGSLDHIISNSLNLWTGAFLVFLHYRKIAFEVTAYLIIATGLWVWVGARGDTYHIGSSGLVYAFSGFLIAGGLLSKDRRLMAVALLAIVLHGGIMYGLLPVDPKISFEGHLFGFLAGILIALYNKRKIKPRIIRQVKSYQITMPKPHWTAITFTEEVRQFDSVKINYKDN